MRLLEILGGVSDPARVCTAHKCDSLGRSVSWRSRMILSPVIVRSPAPAPPPSVATRRSSPSIGTSSMAASQLSVGLLRLPRLRIQHAQAPVAVRLERAHAQFLGQGEGLLVVRLWPARPPGGAPRRNVAEEAQGIRLVATFLALTGMRACARRGRAPPPDRQPASAPPPGRDDRTPEIYSCHGHGLFHACVSSGTASATRPLRVYAAPNGGGELGKRCWKVYVLTDAHSPFEQGECSGQVTVAEGQQADPPRGKHQTAGVINRLGNAEPFVPEGSALGEQAQLGMARGESGTGKHSGQEGLPEVLVAPRTLEERDRLPEAVNRPTIVSLGLVGSSRDTDSPAHAAPHPRRPCRARGHAGRRRWPGHTPP